MRRTRVPVLLAAATLGLTLTSCSDDAEPANADGQESPSVTASSEAGDNPTASEPTTTVGPATDEPSTSASTTPTPTTAPNPVIDPSARLLEASQMGKLNREWRWLVGNDYDTEPDRLVICHRAGVADIGAESVAVREYTSDLDATVRGYLLVAVYPDDVTARRAYAVADSWRKSCRERLDQRTPGNDGVRVTPVERVGTGADVASTYTVFQPTATGVPRIHNIGLARDDRVISLVVVKLEGNDFNYPRGRTPAAVTLRNAHPGG